MVVGQLPVFWLSVVWLLASQGLLLTVRKHVPLQSQPRYPRYSDVGFGAVEAAELTPPKSRSVSLAPGMRTEQAAPAAFSSSATSSVVPGDGQTSGPLTSDRGPEGRAWKLWADLKLNAAQRHKLKTRQNTLNQRWKSLESYTLDRWRNQPSTRQTLREERQAPPMPESALQLFKDEYERKAPEKLQQVEALRNQIESLDEESARLQQELKSLRDSAPAAVTSAAALLPKRQREKILSGISLDRPLLVSPPAGSEMHLLPSSSERIGNLETQLMLLRAEFFTAKNRANAMWRGRLQRERNQSACEDPGEERSITQAAARSSFRHSEVDAALQAQKSQLKVLRSQISVLRCQLRKLKTPYASRKTPSQCCNRPSGEQAMTPSGTYTPCLVSACEGGVDETPEQRLLRLKKHLELQRAYKQETAKAYKHLHVYWKDSGTYAKRVWQAREKRKTLRLQPSDGEDPSEIPEAVMQLYKLMYEQKAPEKHKEMERLREQIAKASRRTEELEKEIQDLEEAQRKKRRIKPQAVGPGAAEQHASLFPTDARPSIHRSESGSTSPGSSATAAHSVSTQASAVATPVNPEVPVATELSRIESRILLTKKKLANARCRIVARRHSAERLAASLPHGDSGTYEHRMVLLRRKEEGVRAAMQEAAQHVRELEELETELVRLEAGAPGAGIFGRRRHRYAARSEARRRAGRATGDTGRSLLLAFAGAPPPEPSTPSTSADSLSPTETT